MQIDVDRGVRVVRAAIEFDWAWTVDDLARFCRRVGWDLTWSSDGSPSLTTDFAINRPDVVVYTDDAERAEEPDWRWSDPTRGARWDLLNVVVSATVSVRAVYVRLVDPDYQLWCDENDRSLAQN